MVICMQPAPSNDQIPALGHRNMQKDVPDAERAQIADGILAVFMCALHLGALCSYLTDPIV
jgi:hypothetical protein